MAKGKWQISNGPEDHLPFALCHLPFAILFTAFCRLPTADCPLGVIDDG
jgi:hypothetical protein